MLLRTIRVVALFALLAGLIAGCVPPSVEELIQTPTKTDADSSSSSTDSVAQAVLKPGGTWTRVIDADALTLNPILTSDSVSSAVGEMLFPVLIKQDAFTGEFTSKGSMSESWTMSDDGLTWMFKLRDGITWSDGDPVDAADFKFTYDAIGSELVETVRKSLVEPIESITVIDPLTVAIKFKSVRCDAISNVGLGWLPSHLYADDFSDIMTSPLNEMPTVSAGPFSFQNWTRGDSIILARNETFWEGTPLMDGMIYRIALNAEDRLSLLQTGEIDTAVLEPTQLSAVAGNSEIEVFNAVDDGYDFIALNLANPTNPQPGVDKDGNLVVQDTHPILGDVGIRRAMAHALDYSAIIENIYLGQGYPLAANVLPSIEWAYDATLVPYDYNPNLARQILDTSGWIDANNDGIREKDGSRLSLTLLTSVNNKIRVDLAELIQDQLNAIGFDITVEALDSRVVVDRLLAQTFDAAIIGWAGLGADPNDEVLWKPIYDVPGSGFNYVSFQSARIDELLTQGVTMPGCAPEDRAPIYKEVQSIIHDQVPYIFLSGAIQNIGYRNNWGNVDPGPWSFYWNVHTWYNRALQP